MSLTRNEANLASVSCLDDPVRRRLYAFISGCRESAGRDEAAAAVGIGRALAVYHLDKMVDAGLLTASYRRPPGRRGPGAGRPAKVYARSCGEFTVTVPVREYELAARLLVQALAADRAGQAPAALQAAARELGGRLAGLAPLEIALAEHGYEPNRDATGTIRMRNCPFRHLAELDPGLICHMNLALIQGLTAIRGLHPVLDPQPEHCCVAIPNRTAAPVATNGTP